MNKGRTGERLFSNIMSEKGYSVEDVSGNPQYWYKDIDFIITSPSSGLTKTFEVKWDSRINKTHNLYIELTNVNSKGGKGWFTFCEADYLAYGDAAARCFYIIPLLELKNKINNNKVQCRTAQCGYDSTGLLVCIDDISDIVELL